MTHLLSDLERATLAHLTDPSRIAGDVLDVSALTRLIRLKLVRPCARWTLAGYALPDHEPTEGGRLALRTT